MDDRNIIVLGARSTAMAAATLAAGLSMMSPAMHEPRVIKRGRVKRNRPSKQADRSRKQYVLKGIRP